MANTAFDNLRLEKGMYKEAMSKGKTFTQYLEDVDSSKNYDDGLDAFERQLKRFDIHIKGKNANVVEKFFATDDSAILFPEYISRTVLTGLEKANILPAIVATTSKIDADTYKSIYMDDGEGSKKRKQLRRVGEGALIPATTIRTKEKVTDIFKYGRTLDVTYEAIRRKKLNVIEIFFQQIGKQIALDMAFDAINVIISGDGNKNAADIFTLGDETIGGASGTLTYDEYIAFWAEFDPYEMNTVLAPKLQLKDILTLPEFKDPQAGFTFQKDGKLISPLGANLVRSDQVKDLGIDGIVGLDKGLCLEEVVEQGITTESDKIIDRQIEKTVISRTGGFNKLFQPSAKVLKWK
ncbi:phage major capsid protein [Tepidibacter hydrothermalis]|uniref:Phage major capsid protein n=1 Tax=Tepidibacter hydrothermalis TaxID=3036126 RepID=A0ABY8EK45_9FIRM|nr:phage major capsid protein [Tepidibacter hydrothermalis]WFD12464.1 phage major capsid protein [Tepidibacter hydrothermalis]